MNLTNRCHNCDIELSADCSEGLCPRCLLQVGIEGASEQHTAVDASTQMPKNSGIPPEVPEGETRPGQSIRYFGDYQLIEEIARGGMGVVFKARQTTLNRIVAVKMILSGELAGEQEVKRFYIEAEAAAKLDHPNIVPIFEIGNHAGQHYFSMSFVEGQTLAHIVSAGPLEPNRAAQLIQTIAGAISYAHVEGVVHRDLKPANVIVDTEGQPRITDFGLAKRIDTSNSQVQQTNLTATAQVLGTPSYMAPEQATGNREKIGPSADIYALGATLYCLLTGRPPFQSASPLDTILQVMEKEPVPVRQLVPCVSKDLETICLKCLEKEPSRRYDSASSLADDLGRFLNGETIRARQASQIEKTWRWCRRKPLVSGLAAGLVAVIAFGLFFAIQWALNEASLREMAELRQKAIELRDQESREALYAAQFRLVEEAWEQTDVVATRRGLETLRPSSGMPDLRGWEFYYLQGLWGNRCQSFPFQDAFAVSPASPLFAVVDSERGTAGESIIALYNSDTGQKQMTITVGSTRIRALDFSNDGKKLAAATGDSMLKIWQVDSGDLLATLAGHEKEIGELKWSPDGRHIISVDADEKGNVFVWDVQKQSPIARLKNPNRPSQVGWDSVGKQAFAIEPFDSFSLWETNTWKSIVIDRELDSELSNLSAYTASWSPDGSRIAFAGLARDLTPVVLLWNTKSKECSFLKGHTKEVVSIAWSNDGKKLVSGSNDKTVKIWDALSGQILQTLTGHVERVDEVAWSHDNRQVISRGWGGEFVNVWQTQPTTYAIAIPASGGIEEFSWNSSGNQIVIGATVWDDSGTETWHIPNSGGVTKMSPNGRLIAAASETLSDQGMEQIHVWDALTHSKVATLAGHRGSINNLVWNADSTQLASTSLAISIPGNSGNSLFESDEVIRVWNVATESELLTVDVTNDNVTCLAWSPDCKRIVWASGAMLKFFSSDGSEGLPDIQTNGSVITSIDWSPDSQNLVIGFSTKNSVDVWNVPTGTKLFELNGLAGGTNSVDWSCDKYRIATAGKDGTVRVWDTRTGQELLRFAPTTFKRIGADQVRWSRNGESLAAFQDDEFRVWTANLTDSPQ